MDKIRGFIFDLDGTLVSSSLDFGQIKTEIGCPEHQDILLFIDQLPTDKQNAAIDVVHHHELMDAQTSEWMPGAQAFVDKCLVHNIPMAIVTRNSHHSSQVKIEKNTIPINYLVTRENSKPKPDPSALIEIASVFKLQTHEILMVGDYLYDLEAGRNAQMQSCLVHYDDLPEYADIADFTFPSFVDLYKAKFGV